jgi:magnesium chelatase family protein
VVEHLRDTSGDTSATALPQHVAAVRLSAAAYPDCAEVRGQHSVKRALEVAAACRHSVLMVGPPGAGKTMLAQRLPGILPPMSGEEALESAAVLSLVGKFAPQRWATRIIRSPHHTASAAAIVGGGGNPMPGEISIAHHGVLFLDELPEFDRRVLEVLREPIESGRITVSRAARSVDFPARFQLVAAMNPCPCGYLGDPTGRCRCSTEQIARYRNKLSGPLLDRIDLHLTVARETTTLNNQRGFGWSLGTVRRASWRNTRLLAFSCGDAATLAILDIVSTAMLHCSSLFERDRVCCRLQG